MRRMLCRRRMEQPLLFLQCGPRPEVGVSGAAAAKPNNNNDCYWYQYSMLCCSRRRQTP